MYENDVEKHNNLREKKSNKEIKMTQQYKGEGHNKTTVNNTTI